MATNNTVNRIELIGYMGAMPELRYTGNGTPVTNFSLATNRIWLAPDLAPSGWLPTSGEGLLLRRAPVNLDLCPIASLGPGRPADLVRRMTVLRGRTALTGSRRLCTTWQSILVI